MKHSSGQSAGHETLSSQYSTLSRDYSTIVDSFRTIEHIFRTQSFVHWFDACTSMTQHGGLESGTEDKRGGGFQGFVAFWMALEILKIQNREINMACVSPSLASGYGAERRSETEKQNCHCAALDTGVEVTWSTYPWFGTASCSATPACVESSHPHAPLGTWWRVEIKNLYGHVPAKGPWPVLRLPPLSASAKPCRQRSIRTIPCNASGRKLPIRGEPPLPVRATHVHRLVA